MRAAEITTCGADPSTAAAPCTSRCRCTEPAIFWASKAAGAARDFATPVCYNRQLGELVKHEGSAGVVIDPTHPFYRVRSTALALTVGRPPVTRHERRRSPVRGRRARRDRYSFVSELMFCRYKIVPCSVTMCDICVIYAGRRKPPRRTADPSPTFFVCRARIPHAHAHTHDTV